MSFLTAALTAQTQNDANIFRLAQAFEQQGDVERAVVLYSDLFRSDSNNFQYFDALRRSYVQLKRYDDAIQLSIRRLRVLPFDFSLQANIGGLYVIAGQERKADSVWSLILASSNKNPLIYRTVAAEQVNQRLFDKAIGTYLAGRREIGDQFLFANELGYLYSFMMDYQKSVHEYLLLIRQNEQQYDFVISRLATLVTKPEGLRAAMAVVDSEVSTRRSIPLLRLQMWLFLEDKRSADAFRVAKQIEQLLNSNGMELFQFAERLTREKEFRIAAEAYTAALSKNLPVQTVPMARYGYAYCIEQQNSIDDSVSGHRSVSGETVLESQPSVSAAMGLYATLAKEFPFSAVGTNALYRIGWIRYKKLYDLDGALTLFDSVLVIAPGGPMVPTVLATIGDIYVLQNKLGNAEQKYLALSRSPYADADQKNLAQYRLAEIQFFGNNFDSALTILMPLTQNLKADETNDALILQYFITENRFMFPDALKQYARAELFARQNKTNEAVQQLLSIVDVYPTAPLSDDALLTAAGYLVQLKRYADALKIYHRILDEYKTSAIKEKTYFSLGELYQWYLNDTPKAIESYSIILEKYPFSLFVDEARKRIRTLRGDAI